MKLSLLGRLSNIQILVHTLIKGKYAGTDQFGNKYYKAKPRKGYKNERRWVIYKSDVDASMIPAEWHAWIHHQTNEIPANENKHRKDWIKQHQPNLTGTDQAYKPKGFKNENRPASSADYVAWHPSKIK